MQYGINLAAFHVKEVMKKPRKKSLPQDKDPHLDTPGEANTDKHINFLDIESTANEDSNARIFDREADERQKEWKRGIEEGKKARGK